MPSGIVKTFIVSFEATRFYNVICVDSRLLSVTYYNKLRFTNLSLSAFVTTASTRQHRSASKITGLPRLAQPETRMMKNLKEKTEKQLRTWYRRPTGKCQSKCALYYYKSDKECNTEYLVHPLLLVCELNKHQIFTIYL